MEFILPLNRWPHESPVEVREYRSEEYFERKHSPELTLVLIKTCFSVMAAAWSQETFSGGHETPVHCCLTEPPHLCGLRGCTDWGLPSWIPFLWHNRGETGALIVDCNPLATQRRRTKKQPKPLKILYLTPHLSVCWEPWEKIQRLRPEHCGCQESTPKQKEGLLL